MGGAIHAPAPIEAASTAPASGDSVIQAAREAALQFIQSLPDFTATRFTNRFASKGSRSSWKALDVLSADVVFENGKETSRNTLVNGKPTRDGQTPGSWSTGEIAATLQSVMAPQTNADFTNKRPVALGNRATFRYDYSVERANSSWTVIAGQESYTTAYGGSIWIDQENQRVLRIEMAARNLPASLQFDAVESEVDYQYFPVGGRMLLLPAHSEVLSCARGTGDCIRNVVSFENYMKLGADKGGAGLAGGPYNAGADVSDPVLLHRVDAEYSEAGRAARVKGVVVLRVVVDERGNVVDPKVITSLGYGLDENAIAAVSQWKFTPGYKGGKPVPVIKTVEMSFVLQ
jgi:TonB family protein